MPLSPIYPSSYSPTLVDQTYLPAPNAFEIFDVYYPDESIYTRPSAGWPVLVIPEWQGFTSTSKPAALTSALTDFNGALGYAALNAGFAVVMAMVTPANSAITGRGRFRPPTYGSFFLASPYHAFGHKDGATMVQKVRQLAAAGTMLVDPNKVAIGANSGGALASAFGALGQNWQGFGGFFVSYSSRANACILRNPPFWFPALSQSGVIVGAALFPLETDALNTEANAWAGAGATTLAAGGEFGVEVSAQFQQHASIGRFAFNTGAYPGLLSGGVNINRDQWCWVAADEACGSNSFDDGETAGAYTGSYISDILTNVHDSWNAVALAKALRQLGSTRARLVLGQAPHDTILNAGKFQDGSATPVDKVADGVAAHVADAVAWLLGVFHAEPVQERILQDIQSTLDSIENGGDYYVLGGAKVYRENEPMPATTTSPAILIGQPRTSEDDTGNQLTSARVCRLETTLTAMALCSGVSTGTSQPAPGVVTVERMNADLRRALFADRTRGGNAVNTRIAAHDGYYSAGDGGNWAIVEVRVEVDYRTELADLSVAL